MARRLGQSISKTAALVGCSRSAVVSIYQKLSKEGTVVNRRLGHGRPRLIDARGERRLARVVRSIRGATVAQIAQEVNAGSDRKVSEYTVHHSLLRMGVHSRIPVLVPMLTPVHRRKRQQWEREHQKWSTEQWKMVAWSDESCFLLHHVYGQVHVHHLPGEHMVPGCTMGRRIQRFRVSKSLERGAIASTEPERDGLPWPRFFREVSPEERPDPKTTHENSKSPKEQLDVSSPIE
ncbi:Transposable element Tc1 transposase [Anabarilius grahami]|uniref:Transposable element Tc1 transposase n=1 Tax=Anabarilius grahami TaxID=495550 RepID=A0A3N0YV31_ANAGA|nr:Transposable element Tc1 transposase [Anabarilius grahami]